MTRIHVCKQLLGMDTSASVEQPFAKTERGQIYKIAELNAAGPRWKYCEERKDVVYAGPRGGDCWTRAVMGGGERVKKLKHLFKDLQARGIVLTIMTKGYVGASRKVLQAEGLWRYFDKVIGFIGDNPSYGVGEYDKILRAPSELEGEASCAATDEKS